MEVRTGFGDCCFAHPCRRQRPPHASIRGLVGELLALTPVRCMDGVVFRTLPGSGSGFLGRNGGDPGVADRRKKMVEAHVIQSVGEVPSGGNPELSAGSGGIGWRFAALLGFRKDVRRQPDLFERVANAIVEVSKDPMKLRGNTIKRLAGDETGYWRYRPGDFRLVYPAMSGRRHADSAPS